MGDICLKIDIIGSVASGKTTLAKRRCVCICFEKLSAGLAAGKKCYL